MQRDPAAAFGRQGQGHTHHKCEAGRVPRDPDRRGLAELQAFVLKLLLCDSGIKGAEVDATHLNQMMGRSLRPVTARRAGAGCEGAWRRPMQRRADCEG